MGVFHIVTLGLLAYGGVSLLILLSGIAAVHSELTDLRDSTAANNTLGLAWWAMIFTIGLLISVGIATVRGTIRASNGLHIPLLCSAFALLCVTSHESVVLARNIKDGDLDGRANAWAAGSVMTTLGVILLILWLGSFDMIVEVTTKRPQDKVMSTNEAQKAAPTPIPPPPPGPAPAPAPPAPPPAPPAYGHYTPPSPGK